MANRDYFKKPIQSDRNSFGYGNTNLDRKSEGWGGTREAPCGWQGPYWLYAFAAFAFVLIAGMSA